MKNTSKGLCLPAWMKHVMKLCVDKPEVYEDKKLDSFHVVLLCCTGYGRIFY